MSTRPHRAHQDIDPAKLSDQLQRQRPVGADVVGVAVLVRIPRAGVFGHQLRNPVLARLLPSADRVRLRHHIDAGAVGGQHARDDGFQPRVGDQGDRVPVHLTSEG
ncbi:Uncharacterised protein [Mycobacterium tuberculosis]|uniref:Uncharacterized protein n=1 Tax=Mycobacterium tuberculosis TaxID=1773 RepID=A0A654U4K0_MYCTX|nr:Uncharacterised protein [Mycobacterium tuberculosis]CKR71150.1 Uncharacterised protein [Mycobacterium tuberculosis]CKT08839.1 Uncharacterised protein [Mycobacterium tuberculosis]CKT33313.1 Uncharacterised protein [Mycobacterium tuberculosis]CNV85382.1 Uncharacterised protein [Mycobacterium tuberculosis]